MINFGLICSQNYDMGVTYGVEGVWGGRVKQTYDIYGCPQRGGIQIKKFAQSPFQMTCPPFVRFQTLTSYNRSRYFEFKVGQIPFKVLQQETFFLYLKMVTLKRLECHFINYVIKSRYSSDCECFYFIIHSATGCSICGT